MAGNKTDQLITDLENKAVREAANRYDELVSSLILIATSNRTRREKIDLINEQKKKMIEFNKEFSQEKTKLFYLKFNKKAFEEARILEPSIGVKKKLSVGQNQELKGLADQLNLGLEKRLNTLIDEAKQLVAKEELIRVQQEKIGLKPGAQKKQITASKLKKDLPFTNSKGQRVNMGAVMRLTVGDPVFNTLISSLRSEWIRLGFRYVVHLSVLDEKTTPICRSLHDVRRNLFSDPLPPMHIGCRSKVQLLKDGWDQAVFFRNFS